MKQILGDAKNIRTLLGNAKYAIDYYQREYRWQTKHVTELINDLAGMFRESYEDGHERSAVENYGRYFLGSIIISNRDGHKFIIDGQQRLTSLTLLLIYLNSLLEDAEQQGQVAKLIFSQRYGKKSFNLDVPERTECMEALYTGQPFEENGQTESIRNILARYSDIEDNFPEDVNGKVLPYFVDWLIENVFLVEITAYSDEDAYTIFETMNDRGLSLTSTDMLKGYLLANIQDTDQRGAASRVWKGQIEALRELGKEEDADGIKSWLRSQHAESIRERKRGASPLDFDLIGTEFHRWVRDHEDALGLRSGSDFARFINRDFCFYTRQYQRLREAAETFTPGLENVFYNAQHNFTLQYPVLLAPLQMDDSSEDIARKLRITASYLDILIARRIWNFRAIDYSTMQYAMFLIMRDIRGRDSAELTSILREKLDAEDETFSTNDRFQLHGQNGRQIHRILARMMEYIETQSGMPNHFVEYSTRRGKNGYEVEHIWANHSERHTDEFTHPADFKEYRNRFGGLLLLPKSFNASYGDLPYDEKRPHYLKQNLLAQSLCPEGYEHAPGFQRLIRESGLKFHPHEEFKKSDLDARHELYRELAEKIWNPARLE
jgi:hypothetical protein